MNYRVVVYGQSEHGFWNQPAFHSKLNNAVKHYTEVVFDQPEGFLGVVLVEVDHEDFKVLNRVGEEYEVIYNFGVLRVSNKQREVVLSDI
jgi:hypothetical protein